NLQEKIDQLKKIESELREFQFQIESTEAQLREIDKSLDILENAKDLNFQKKGSIFFLMTPNSIKDDLTNKKELLKKIRTRLASQEQQQRVKFQVLQEEVQKLTYTGSSI
ncbi:MAG: prefoldin subunit, partial [Promethearchaeota archaeon]